MAVISAKEYHNQENKHYVEISGKAFDVDEFLAMHNEIPADFIWRTGDTLDFDEHSLPFSGFRVYFTEDVIMPSDYEGRLLDFFVEHYIELSSLRIYNAVGSVHLFAYQGEEELEMSQALMGLMAGFGFGFTFAWKSLPEESAGESEGAG